MIPYPHWTETHRESAPPFPQEDERKTRYFIAFPVLEDADDLTCNTLFGAARDRLSDLMWLNDFEIVSGPWTRYAHPNEHGELLWPPSVELILVECDVAEYDAVVDLPEHE